MLDFELIELFEFIYYFVNYCSLKILFIKKNIILYIVLYTNNSINPKNFDIKEAHCMLLVAQRYINYLFLFSSSFVYN